MGGMVSGVAQKIGSAAPSGGKSSPAPQNAYGSSYQAPAANVYQPSYSGPQQSMGGGGKSSGLGQGGYGAAPAFNQQPMGGIGQVVQNLVGGKSSGMGQGGYQSAPSFNPFQQQQQFNQFQQQPQFNQFQQQQQFNPFQQQFGGFQQPQQQFSPFQQQFGGFQQQQPQGISGLQGLYNSMMNQQQQMRQPMQRQPMQQYQDPALQYRPNMQNAQAALSRVRPSVQRQNQDAQAARIAELEAQIAAQQQQSYYNPYDYGGG